MAVRVHQVREVVTDDPDVAEPAVTHNGVTMLQRFVYFITSIIVGLLAIRFIFSLLGANRGNAFANFIYSVTQPLVAPFFGLFNYTMRYGVARFEFETLVAIVVYLLIGILINQLLSIMSDD